MTPRAPVPARIVKLDVVDSTNAEAARLVADPATPVPVWIMARRQTAGRGRHGRAWASPEGNLYATLLDRPAMAPAAAAQLSFAACLAVADLLASLAPSARVGLKWPNDALLNGRKAAGVLLESSGRAGRLDWLAIGIGVNLENVPARESVIDPRVAPCSVTGEGGRRVTPDEALAMLADRLAYWKALHAAEGFGPLRTAWLGRAAGLGTRIEARLSDRVLSGTYEDVDATGALVLRTPQGARRIAAADLHFPD